MLDQIGRFFESNCSMISNQATHHKESEGKKMPNWRDTFDSKLDPNERAKREAKQLQVQAQAQYAAINRGDIKTPTKQVTSQTLQNLIKKGGEDMYAALAIVRILINFKSNEKKGGDANQAGIALVDLERHAQAVDIRTQDLMEFVKNRSAFFQRQIPETFKQLLISIMPSNINALVTAENGPFLISNGVINNQQLRAVVTRQDEEGPPLEKIKMLFNLIQKKTTGFRVFAKTLDTSIVQSIRDGYRAGVYEYHPASERHLVNMLNLYIIGIERRYLVQKDLRFEKTKHKKMDGVDIKYASFDEKYNGSTSFSSGLDVMDSMVLEFKKEYKGNDSAQLINSFEAAIKRLTEPPKERPFVELSGPAYNTMMVYQEGSELSDQQRKFLSPEQKKMYFQINNKNTYDASRKSANLSNGPQYINNNASHINPDSIDPFQSGSSMGLDESALVVFSQNQAFTNKLMTSWSGYTNYRSDEQKDWDIQTLLLDISPELHRRKGVLFSAAPLSVDMGYIHYDFLKFRDRIVTYKGDLVWKWNNRVFYETIQADVKITWNFQANYVHYEVLSKFNRLTLERLVHPEHSSNLPKNTKSNGQVAWRFGPNTL